MHVWCIMDWNRRWAKEHFQPTILWHKAWFDNARKIIELSVKSQVIDCLTLWALSKENLQEREQEELKWIIKMINKLEVLLPDLQANNIKFDTVWDIGKLPEESQQILAWIKDKTSLNTWMDLVAALVYSWQDEIVRATRKILNDGISSDDLNEEKFRQYTDFWKFPVMDLIIRTWIHNWTESKRHSWFDLYDSAYAEYYFTHTLWPDLSKDEFFSAIDQFYKTKRTKWK